MADLVEACPWTELWIGKGMPIFSVPGTSMIEIHGVRGFLTPGDVQFLWDFAATLPPGATHVEVGCWLGLSSIVCANSLLAQLNLGARIHCVDTWEGSPEHEGMTEIQTGELFYAFLRNIENAKVRHFIQPWRGSSVRIAESFQDESVDSVFIDGNHSYEGCLADITAWLPKLKKGGRMIGHDAVPEGGVDRVVREVAAAHGLGFEVLPPPHAHFMWELIGC